MNKVMAIENRESRIENRESRIVTFGFMKSQENSTKHQSNLVYGTKGISPALCSSGDRMRCYTWILVKTK